MNSYEYIRALRGNGHTWHDIARRVNVKYGEIGTKNYIRSRYRQEHRNIIHNNILTYYGVKVLPRHKTILVIGDTHFPYECDNFVYRILKIRDLVNPDIVIHIGDVFEYFNPAAQYPTFKLFKKEFPILRVCIGNHDVKPFYKDSESFVPFSKYWNVPNWDFAQSYVTYDKSIVILHGFNTGNDNPTLEYSKEIETSVVMGHTHSATLGMYNIESNNNISGKFALNVGASVNSKKLNKLNNKRYEYLPAITCGVITNGQPQLIRL